MRHLWIYLLPIILFSCKEDSQSHHNTQPKQRTPYKDSTWVYHELKLRKDIGTISFYLPKEYSIYNQIDHYNSDWMCGSDLCDLVNIYEFSVEHTNSTIKKRMLDTNYCFTVLYKSFTACDSEKLHNINASAIKWIEREYNINHGNRTQYTHSRSDSMNIGKYPYYTSIIRNMPVYNNNNYMYYAIASVIINDAILNISLLYYYDKKYSGNFEETFNRIISTVQIRDSSTSY